MMKEAERRALAALRFNWAPTPDDVWRPSLFHEDGLHRAAVDLVMGSVAEADREMESSPIGVAVQGQRGTGKTHLLGTVREHVQAAGGYFFLVSLLDAPAFWQSVALSILDGFARAADGRTNSSWRCSRGSNAIRPETGRSVACSSWTRHRPWRRPVS